MIELSKINIDGKWYELSDAVARKNVGRLITEYIQNNPETFTSLIEDSVVADLQGDISDLNAAIIAMAASGVSYGDGTVQDALDDIGDLYDLDTDTKDSIVAAINEVLEKSAVTSESVVTALGYTPANSNHTHSDLASRISGVENLSGKTIASGTAATLSTSNPITVEYDFKAGNKYEITTSATGFDCYFSSEGIIGGEGTSASGIATTASIALEDDRDKVEITRRSQGSNVSWAIKEYPKLAAKIDNKVDKVSGKGLSTNDYTSADKAKVGEIPQIKEDIGALDDLTTTDKSSLVAAINEAAASGGTGGTTNYNDLSNKPQINGIALKGNKTGAYLGLASASHSHDQSDITGLADALAGKAASSHTHTATQVSGLATVATSGSYNDLLNKPSIPAATTVTQTLTSGTEIGAVNGTKLYAPAGGGSGGWTKVFDHTVTEDEAASLTYISVTLTGNEKGILFLYAQTAGTVTTNGAVGVSGNAKSPWSDAGAKQITTNIQGITSGHKIQLGAFDIVENVLYPRQAFMSSNTAASSNVAGIWSYGLKFCVQQDTDYVPLEVTPQNRMYFNIGTYNTGWFGSGARLVVLTK